MNGPDEFLMSLIESAEANQQDKIDIAMDALTKIKTFTGNKIAADAIKRINLISAREETKECIK